MNILIEPIFIGLIQTIISIALISGVIYTGSIINIFFFQKYNHIFLNLLISIIFFSQLLKIFTYLGLFKEAHFILSFVLLFFGIYNIKNFLKFLEIKNLLLKLGKKEFLITAFIFSLFIVSISPPSMADALDYHFGIPLYLLKFNILPSINLWLYGNVGGNGDIINSTALYFGSDNFGSLIQFSSLLLFFLFLKKEINERNKFNFLIVFILSSPTILQLISGPKFMLLPQLMTTAALYFFIKLKKIRIIDFIFIVTLLMGATQFKSSFIISGSLIGLLIFFKAFVFDKIKILLITLLLFSFFFIPTAIWNFFQISDFDLINIFTLMPEEMMNNMKSFRENNIIYPFNLFIPDSLGSISTILGFQFLLLFLSFKKTRKFNSIILITLGTIVIHYFIGMNVSRMYYEYVLWLAISFVFINDKRIDYKFYRKLILPQLLLIFCFSLYFATISIPTIFSNKSRDVFMIKNSYNYAAIKWINKTLPPNARVISRLRSVSFLKNEFISMDSLDFGLTNESLINYVEQIKEKKMNYIILYTNQLKNHPFKNCLGPRFAQSDNFILATRNPMNNKFKYKITIFHFNYDQLPICFKN